MNWYPAAQAVIDISAFPLTLESAARAAKSGNHLDENDLVRLEKACNQSDS